MGTEKRESLTSKELLSNAGILIILTGGTAVGKTELKERLSSKHSNISPVITTTTREPRLEKGERDGVDYHFISRELFADKIDSQEFIEFAPYDGNLYGTTKSEINQLFEGKNLISAMEMSGAAKWNRNIRKAYEKEKAEKIIANTLIVLVEAHEDVQRLRSVRRSMGKVGNLEERLLEDKILMEKYWDKFPNRIFNDEDEIENSLQKLENLVCSSFPLVNLFDSSK